MCLVFSPTGDSPTGRPADRHSSILEDNNSANDAGWRIGSPATLQRVTRAWRIQRLVIWSSALLSSCASRLCLNLPNYIYIMTSNDDELCTVISPPWLLHPRSTYSLTKNCSFLSRYNPKHVLHPLLPQPKNSGHNLRQRTHNLVLPWNVNTVVKQNFIYSMLFRDIYYKRCSLSYTLCIFIIPLYACAYAICFN